MQNDGQFVGDENRACRVDMTIIFSVCAAKCASITKCLDARTMRAVGAEAGESHRIVEGEFILEFASVTTAVRAFPIRFSLGGLCALGDSLHFLSGTCTLGVSFLLLCIAYTLGARLASPLYFYPTRSPLPSLSLLLSFLP